jgi:uncharacterized protein YegP (UPF0339 family)
VCDGADGSTGFGAAGSGIPDDPAVRLGEKRARRRGDRRGCEPTFVSFNRRKALAMWNYQLFEDRSGQWRWHLVGGNGRVVATSGESFASRYDAERAAGEVKANAGAAGLPSAPYGLQVLAGIVAAARRRAAYEAAVGGGR